MGNAEAEQLQEVFSQLRDVHETLDPLNAQITGLSQERAALLADVSQQIGENVLGKMIRVSKIGDVEDDFTIARYEVMNPRVVHTGRTLPGYVRPLYNIPRQSSVDLQEASGKVIAIDVKRNSLIMRPNSLRKIGLGFGRYWVRLIDGSGEPVVDIKSLED